MATVNFYLDKADKEGKSPILMTYQANGQKFRHSIKIKILASQWLIKKQRLKVNSLDDEMVNNHIKGLEEVITKAERQSLLTNQQIDFSFVKQRFNDSLGKTDEKKKTFIEYFVDYIENSKSQKKLETTKRYQTTLNHLLKFKKVKKYELTFERIDIKFYESFIGYLTNTKKLLNNSVGNYVKTVKSFMNFALENGYCQNVQDFKKFKVFKEEAELIYMTEDEVMKLVYLEKGMTDKLRTVRDNFCFACFTGLRYSDISILKPENIKEDVLLIKTEKTRDFLQIPLNRFAKEILSHNGGILPKMASNQKTNDYLKELGELAEINEVIHIVKYRGVEKVEFLKPKYKFICTHTARRTFVTLCLEKGMRPETVMSITGHRDYKTFKKYIKLTDKVKIMEMNKIWGTNMQIA